MKILLRNYRETDAAASVSVFREGSQSLRKSQGGTHPDEAIDKLADMSDKEVWLNYLWGATLVVAEVKETGEVIGLGGIKRGRFDRLIGSAYSTTHYVKPSFQKGRAGVPVGSLLRAETITRAKAIGCRKMYGFSTPEAVRFHKKFGARFYPLFNRDSSDSKVRIRYYEIDLRPSIWNMLKIEPFAYSLNELGDWLFVVRVILFGPPKRKAMQAKPAEAG